MSGQLRIETGAENTETNKPETVAGDLDFPVLIDTNASIQNKHILTLGADGNQGQDGTWYALPSADRTPQPTVGATMKGWGGTFTNSQGDTIGGPAAALDATNYFNLFSNIPNVSTPGIIAQSVGGASGSGATGGLGGDVRVENHGWIFNASAEPADGTMTHGSMGILAQSIGGTGTGGQSGGDSSQVTVTNFGNITIGGKINGTQTSTPNSPGIVARSIGAFGSNGTTECGFLCFYGYGTNGGNGGDADRVFVTNSGEIKTGDVHSPAILALSVGGGGGNGGAGRGIEGVGGNAGQAGNGSDVFVTNNSAGTIVATKSRGIQAQSVAGGGGDGGVASGLVSVGGQGGSSGFAGEVVVNNAANISSDGASIFAQSIAGGGGAGGSSGGIDTIGGSGSSGGTAGQVRAGNSGDLAVFGDHHSAIHAQSVGGGGGHGGAATAGGLDGTVAIGGSGSGGGTGGAVIVGNSGTLSVGTQSDKTNFSHGIFAQSSGGGGGSGGVAVSGSIGIGADANLAIGGSAGSAGAGGSASVFNCVADVTDDSVAPSCGGGAGKIVTTGDHSSGIFAQSHGGGGGAGGIAVEGGIAAGVQVGLSIGGKGGSGGDAGGVVVTSQSGLASLDDLVSSDGSAQYDIVTAGGFSSGIFSQSVGGGGGSGGLTVGGGAGRGASINATLGGTGGDGGDAGTVTLSSSSAIATSGDHSHGALAQSIGGGGGAGGAAISGSVSDIAVSLAHGGSGGGGGAGGAVTATFNTFADKSGGAFTSSDASDLAVISTSGAHANALIAQSIGGGGGAGGTSVSGSISRIASVAAAYGGNGGGGGKGGAVTLKNELSLQTQGVHSAGIVAQSVGGGGGSGGVSVSGSVSAGTSVSDSNLSLSFGDGRRYPVSASEGGDGNAADVVTVTSDGAIKTAGSHSSGVVAQSIGGGGGHGGFSGAFSLGPKNDVSLAMGGNGGSGNTGGAVTVTTSNAISSAGEVSHGVLAQSIGGGGGHGGLTVSGALAGPSGRSVSLAFGGNGGSGENGAAVNVNTDTGSTITTSSTHSSAISAQSIGGGGGNGAISVSAAVGNFALSAIPGVSFGNTAGTGGKGEAVTVASGADLTTGGDFSTGLLAQSLGGGGGVGGTHVVADINAKKPTEADESKGVNINLGASGVDGGNAGTAGAVKVQGPADPAGSSTRAALGSITTDGKQAPGIMAQSVGGGGGTGGWSASANVQVRSSGDKLPAIGFAHGASGGPGGVSGDVNVEDVSHVTTVGDHSEGVFAQSVGGGGGRGGMAVAFSFATKGNQYGGAGQVSAALGGAGGHGSSGGDTTVSTGSDSRIQTAGDSSAGIFAQSVGGGGGQGGGAIAIAAGLPSGASISHGGTGGGGGAAGDVTVSNSGAISTGTTSGNTADTVFTDSRFGGSSLGGIKTGNHSPAIFAQSVGGGGGNAGFSIAASAALKNSGSMGLSLGGSGGNGNTSGIVSVASSSGKLQTSGDFSSGIHAQSVGGGGGHGGFSIAGSISTSSSNESFSFGGKGGTGGDAGTVTVTNSSDIATSGNSAGTILAQSIGGGGGSGGFSVAGGIELSVEGPAGQLSAALGGNGGAAGNSDAVNVTTTGGVTLESEGTHAPGIFGQSVGGGGGNGGFSVVGNVALAGDGFNGAGMTIGGFGEGGGTASDVTVTAGSHDALASITTSGAHSTGVKAQSVGGGGGHGGFSIDGSIDLTPKEGTSMSLSLGGQGGGGADAAAVTVDYTGRIKTGATHASGIMAQSVGGSGGSGGFSVTGDVSMSGSGTASASLSLGGDGAGAGDGKNVTAKGASDIETLGGHSAGVLLHSIGGGGGAGGYSVAGDLSISSSGQNVTARAAIGGTGAGGGAGGAVTGDLASNVKTRGHFAPAIQAQSIGGGGGTGGFGVAGDLTLKTSGSSSATGNLSVGGNGGKGGAAGAIDIRNGGGAQLTTAGIHAPGISAQSIGGGGGVAAYAVSGDLAFTSDSDSDSLNLAVGGAGGTAGAGGAVKVSGFTAGSVATAGVRSHGIEAQSIGGGGGTGGMSVAGSLTLGSNAGDRETSGNLNLGIGGKGGANGDGGAVEVGYGGDITTTGLHASGILAQSIGGGGGHGGLSIATSGSPSSTVKSGIGLSVGGQGGASGDGGNVKVEVGPQANAVAISTSGDAATGILAQSIGGGGGVGLFDIDQVKTLDSSFGVSNGKTATSGDGAAVVVDNSGSVSTSGVNASAIVAQSIGGGGGIAVTNLSSLGYTGEFPKTEVATNRLAGGHGGAVAVDNRGDITTTGNRSIGIVAQSIGGGGGLVSDGRNPSGYIGTSTWLGGSGDGDASDAGNVGVKNFGDINTSGIGILAQSIAGGGGISFASVSSTGGAGKGTSGNVVVENSATIVSTDSAGIFAQSFSGDSIGGSVSVQTLADVTATGDRAAAIVAHSYGPSGGTAEQQFARVNIGNHDTTDVTVKGGVATGFGGGTGVWVHSETTARVDNFGTITMPLPTADKPDIAAIRMGGAGTLTVNNQGTINGGGSSVGRAIAASGSGVTTINNGSDGTITGIIDVAAGSAINNAGTLQLGDTFAGSISNTGQLNIDPVTRKLTISGDYTGNTDARLVFNVDTTSSNDTDNLSIGGDITPDSSGSLGTVVLDFGNASGLASEWDQWVSDNPFGGKGGSVFTAQGGVTVINFDGKRTGQFRFESGNSAVLQWTGVHTDNSVGANFNFNPEPEGLSSNQRAVLEAFSKYWIFSEVDNEGILAEFVQTLVSQPTVESVGDFYDQLNPQLHASGSSAAVSGSNHHVSNLIKLVRVDLKGQSGLPSSAGVDLRKELLLAANGDPATVLRGEPIDAQARWGLWARPWVTRTKHAVDPTNEFRSDSRGLTVGLDRRFGRDLLLGVGVGWNATDIAVDGNWGRGDHDSLMVSAYGSYNLGKTSLTGALNYADHDFSNSRVHDLGAGTSVVSSDHDGSSVSLALKADRPLSVGSFVLTPTLGVAWHRLNEDGVAENGAGSLGLVLGERTTTSILSDIGAQLGRTFRVPGGHFTPMLSVSWRHELDGGRSRTPTSFAVATDQSFFVEHTHSVKNRGAYGIDLAYHGFNGARFMLSYNQERASDFRSQRLVGNVRIEF